MCMCECVCVFMYVQVRVCVFRGVHTCLCMHVKASGEFKCVFLRSHSPWLYLFIILCVRDKCM